MAFSERDIIQVAAFHAIYRGFMRDDMIAEEKLAQAVALTSDDAWDRYAKKQPELIERWRREFGTKGRRKKRVRS